MTGGIKNVEKKGEERKGKERKGKEGNNMSCHVMGKFSCAECCTYACFSNDVFFFFFFFFFNADCVLVSMPANVRRVWCAFTYEFYVRT